MAWRGHAMFANEVGEGHTNGGLVVPVAVTMAVLSLALM